MLFGLTKLVVISVWECSNHYQMICNAYSASDLASHGLDIFFVLNGLCRAMRSLNILIYLLIMCACIHRITAVFCLICRTRRLTSLRVPALQTKWPSRLRWASLNKPLGGWSSLSQSCWVCREASPWWPGGGKLLSGRVGRLRTASVWTAQRKMMNCRDGS